MKPLAGTRTPTAPVAAGSLIGGYLLARATGVRPLGGALLGVGGSWCAWQWRKKAGVAPAAALGAVYLAGFGLSHPLAKRVGPWPSVLSVAALSGALSWLLADRRDRSAR